MKVLAAFIFFTRLPFWRIKEVPAKYFKRIVPYWPLAGWLTGGITVGVLWIAAQILPISIAWVLAILSRLLITGCLHEDGLADFFDGFGGGTTKERTLAIMKDSQRIDSLFLAIILTSGKSTFETDLCSRNLWRLLV